jgi:hypothetical protein
MRCQGLSWLLTLDANATEMAMIATCDLIILRPCSVENDSVLLADNFSIGVLPEFPIRNADACIGFICGRQDYGCSNITKSRLQILQENKITCVKSSS